MDIQPILATLTRHRLIAGLLALLVALTCAIVTNVAFMLQQRGALMNIPSGVAEDRVVTLQSFSLDQTANQIARHKADLAALRMIPGVESAAAVDALPFNGNNWTVGVPTSPTQSVSVLASVFNGTPDELQTLGLRLIAGQGLQSDQYVPEQSKRGYDGINHVAAAIVTHALAARLFPHRSALGEVIYPGANNPVRIVGVVAHLARPDVGTGDSNQFSMLLPMLPDTSDVNYILRTQPNDRARVLKAASAALYRLDPDRIVRHGQTFQQLRAKYFRSERTMISLLIASALGLLFVAALGIAGLASFWVQQRTRTIGIRRALGATRADILRYFQTENFLIVTGGVALGAILAVGLNLLLIHYYELARLPLWYLAVGAIALWLLGQLAVLAPALRAAHVPPVVATRSV